MKRLQLLAMRCSSRSCVCIGGDCSRARVESMNHMNEGVIAAVQKQYVDAIKLLESAARRSIRRTTRSSGTWRIVHMEMRKFDRAKETCTKAIAVEPETRRYQEKLGTVLIELKDWNGAKGALEKAIELEPALFKAYYKLAQVERAARRPAERAQALHGRPSRRARASSRRTTRSVACTPTSATSIKSVQVLQEALKVALPGSEEEAQAPPPARHRATSSRRSTTTPCASSKRRSRSCPACVTRCSRSVGPTQLQGNKEEAKRYLQEVRGRRRRTRRRTTRRRRATSSPRCPKASATSAANRMRVGSSGRDGCVSDALQGERGTCARTARSSRRIGRRLRCRITTFRFQSVRGRSARIRCRDGRRRQRS